MDETTTVYKVRIMLRAIQHFWKDILVEAHSEEEAEKLAIEDCRCKYEENNPQDLGLENKGWVSDHTYISDVQAEPDASGTGGTEELLVVPSGTLEEIVEAIQSGPNTEIDLKDVIDLLAANRKAASVEDDD